MRRKLIAFASLVATVPLPALAELPTEIPGTGIWLRIGAPLAAAAVFIPGALILRGRRRKQARTGEAPPIFGYSFWWSYLFLSATVAFSFYRGATGFYGSTGEGVQAVGGAMIFMGLIAATIRGVGKLTRRLSRPPPLPKE
jgi:hypothetical protein